MEILNLQNIPTEEIVDCLNKSFENYFVNLPSDVAFWSQRFLNARVDKELSWGVFVDRKFVGFIVNGIDLDCGEYTAYNSGTGIVPAYRGNRLVGKMYEYGIPNLIENGVSRCSLEVIDKNKKAIGVYKKVGFEITKRLKCYKGTVNLKESIRIQETEIEKLVSEDADLLYSWDNKISTIKKAGAAYKTYEVFDLNNEDSEGYFIINPKTGYIAQLESSKSNWEAIFSGIALVNKDIRINNVLSTREDLIHFLKSAGIENTIDQFEMEMKLAK